MVKNNLLTESIIAHEMAHLVSGRLGLQFRVDRRNEGPADYFVAWSDTEADLALSLNGYSERYCGPIAAVIARKFDGVAQMSPAELTIRISHTTGMGGGLAQGSCFSLVCGPANGT